MFVLHVILGRLLLWNIPWMMMMHALLKIGITARYVAKRYKWLILTLKLVTHNSSIRDVQKLCHELIEAYYQKPKDSLALSAGPFHHTVLQKPSLSFISVNCHQFLSMVHCVGPSFA